MHGVNPYLNSRALGSNYPRGFSADAPEAAIQQISTESTEYKPNLEQDQPVSIS